MGDALGTFTGNGGCWLKEPWYEGDHSADKRNGAE